MAGPFQVSGAETFPNSAAVNLVATASSGYSFTNWTEGGTIVSNSPSYSFTAISNRTLVANFTATGPIVVQPSPGDGKDFSITTYFALATGTNGAGGAIDDTFLRCGGWGDEYRSLIQFDVAALPAQVSSARIRLYAQAAGNTAIYVDRPTAAWQWSPTFVWANRPSYAAFAGPLPAPATAGWYEIDITSLYNAWKTGTYPNYGVQLRPQTTSNNNSSAFCSSNYTPDPTQRPQLVIVP